MIERSVTQLRRTLQELGIPEKEEQQSRGNLGEFDRF